MDKPPVQESVTVVIPVYNSETTLVSLVSRLREVLPSVCDHYEAILVNDGSSDASWSVIEQLARDNDWVHGLKLRRNYGQHNALLCGIRAARHSVIVTMDDDLQHPPEELPRLLTKLAEGFDVVYGVPIKMPHSWWRNLSSRVTKWALANAMGNPNIRDIDAFRAFRSELRDAFANYASPNLLLDVLLSWGTTSFASVPVEHLERAKGRSNYNIPKLIDQTMLMLTGYSVGPLRLASIVGFAFTLFGLGILIFVIGRTLFFGGSIPGFPFLASTIAIFSGAQLFALGIFGEYLARVFNRNIERPTYVVSESTDIKGPVKR